MNLFFLSILHLMLSIFQVLALGSPNAAITILQHLSAVVMFAIFEHLSFKYPRSAQFRHSQIPNVWRLFLSLICLASLASLGSSNSIIHLLRSSLSWLLAGVGGIDAWNFECPKEFRARKVHGRSSLTNPVTAPSTAQAIDQIGYLRLNPTQMEEYNAQCDFVEGLQTTIRNKDIIISRLEIVIEQRDSTIARQQSKLDKQEIELDYWRKHRCPLPGPGQPSLGLLLHQIASLEDALSKSRTANSILVKRLQKSSVETETAPSETHQTNHQTQQAQIASAFFSLPAIPPQPSTEMANAIDTFARYQAQTVSGYGLSATNLPPMVTGAINTPNQLPQAQIPSAPAIIPAPLPPTLPEIDNAPAQPPKAQLDPAPPSTPAADKDTPSASPAAADPPSQPPTSQTTPIVPPAPGRKIKSFKNRVAREERTDNDDLEDSEFDFSYIPPAVIDFTCICKGMSNAKVQLHADQPFGDLAAAWLNAMEDVLKGRGLERIEYGEHLMQLDLSARIDSNALILKEEKGTVHMTLKD